VNELTFSALRKANYERCVTSYKHAIDDWSPTDWACATAGEVGELCNLIKKLRRGEDIPLEDVGREMADVVIYLDLLAARMGLKLDEVVVGKFNESSKKIGSTILLGRKEIE